MARSVEGRLQRLERLERTIGDQARLGWNAVDLTAIADRVCRDFNITNDQLDRLLWEEDDDDGDRVVVPAVAAYWTAFGVAMRKAGLTWLDLTRLADQDGSA